METVFAIMLIMGVIAILLIILCTILDIMDDLREYSNEELPEINDHPTVKKAIDLGILIQPTEEEDREFADKLYLEREQDAVASMSWFLDPNIIVEEEQDDFYAQLEKKVHDEFDELWEQDASTDMELSIGEAEHDVFGVITVAEDIDFGPPLTEEEIAQAKKEGKWISFDDVDEIDF